MVSFFQKLHIRYVQETNKLTSLVGDALGPLDGELVGSEEGEELGSFVTTGAGVVGDNVGAMLDDDRVGIVVVGCDEG